MAQVDEEGDSTQEGEHYAERARQVGAVDAYPRSCVDGLVAISGGVVSPNSLRRGGCGRYLQPLQAGSSTRRSACRPSTCSAGSALWSVARSVCLLQPELRRYASAVRRRFGQPARSRRSSLVGATACQGRVAQAKDLCVQRRTGTSCEPVSGPGHRLDRKWTVRPRRAALRPREAPGPRVTVSTAAPAAVRDTRRIRRAPPTHHKHRCQRRSVPDVPACGSGVPPLSQGARSCRLPSTSRVASPAPGRT
jgi:hypothetical protein